MPDFLPEAAAAFAACFSEWRFLSVRGPTFVAARSAGLPAITAVRFARGCRRAGPTEAGRTLLRVLAVALDRWGARVRLTDFDRVVFVRCIADWAIASSPISAVASEVSMATADWADEVGLAEDAISRNVARVATSAAASRPRADVGSTEAETAVLCGKAGVAETA